MGEIGLNERRWDEAVKVLEVVLKKSPADLDGHLLRGRVHLAKRQTTEAIQAFQEDPQGSDTLGWIFYRRGLHHRALALLKDSAAKLPCNTMIQYHLGMVSAQLGDKDAARQALRIA